MAGSLLDTSVLIGADETAVNELPPTAAISVVSLGELHAGLLLAPGERVRAARGARLAAVRAAFTPLPVDETVALAYGDVLATARRARRTAKATDLLIIATAAAHERTLYTRDHRQRELARATGIPAELL